MGKWDKEAVKVLRKSLRLTQCEFAKRLGCRQQTVSEWEQGVYEPANAYGKLLDLFERSTASEFNNEDASKSANVNHLTKKISSFKLPKVNVPEVFREEMGMISQEPEEEFKPFDPAID
jgi:transcriptional regulator with XRE-family HTH domain